MFGGVFWRCLGVILRVKLTKHYPKQLQKLSTNFLQGSQKRVLPRDSHYFLLGPMNPFQGGYLGGTWNTFGGCFEVTLTQNKPKTIQKQLQKFSTNFLIEIPKRVLPRDSHYFLLGPINPFKGTLTGVQSCLLHLPPRAPRIQREMGRSR